MKSHPILHEGSSMQNIFKLPSGFCCCLVCSKAMILLLFLIVAAIMWGFCNKFWFWQAVDGQTLNNGLVFQEILTSMAKKPYIFVIFRGGGGPLSSPLDQHIDCQNSVDDDRFCSRQNQNLYQIGQGPVQLIPHCTQ